MRAASAIVAALAAAAAVAAATAAEPAKRSAHYRSYLLGRDQPPRLPERPFVEATGMEAAQVVVTPTVLARSGEVATVSWSGITNVVDTDWIGVYLRNDSAHTDYLDYVYVTECPGYASGACSQSFRLWNMRTEQEFRYFQYQGSDAYRLVARSNSVRFAAGAAEPVQAHVGLTGNPTEMHVEFITGTWDTPYVEYGLQPGNYTGRTAGTSKTYTADMMCGSPANIESASYFIDPGVMHDVVLTGLVPGARYYYRFGTLDTWSDERSFKTAPPVGSTGPIRFIAYGDMGQATPGGPAVADQVFREVDDTDFILHFGDLSYAIGRGYLWETFGNLIDPFASRAPYMVSVGNHEYCYLTDSNGKDPSGAPGNGYHPSWGNYGTDSGEECGIPTFYRFQTPKNGNSVFWYSFDYANVHIIQMSSEHGLGAMATDFEPGSVQYQWMENDLASVNRSVTPFVIFTAHRPMYNSERYPSDFAVCEGMQRAFEDLLREYKVDLTLYGHYHSYQRTCPVYQNSCVDDGLVHITVGSAGAWLDLVGFYDVDWDEYVEQVYGIARITVEGNSLLLEFVRTTDGVVSDTLRLNSQF